MPTFLAGFRERWRKIYSDTNALYATCIHAGRARQITACGERRRREMKDELIALLAVADRADFPQDLIDAAKIVSGKESG